MLDQIREDLKQALKSGDKLKVSTLRMLLSDVHNAEISKKSELEEAEIIKLVKKAIKGRKEAQDLYLQGNRAELAEKEEKEMSILQTYLPPQLSEEEVEGVVRSTIQSLGLSSKSDLGRLMKEVMAEYGDRVEGKVVQRIALHLLSPPPPSDSGERKEAE